MGQTPANGSRSHEKRPVSKLSKGHHYSSLWQVFWGTEKVIFMNTSFKRITSGYINCILTVKCDTI